MLRLRRAPDFCGHSIVGEVEKYTGPAVTVDVFAAPKPAIWPTTKRESITRRPTGGKGFSLPVPVDASLPMRVIRLVGRSGSGKTTLIAALLPALVARGLTVSTIKHAHHGFDLDRPGKDSFRHREAGAKEVMLVSDSRWALMHEIGDSPEPPLEELIDRLAPVDLVLIEGFHTHRHPAIEVHRPSEGHDLMWREGSDIIAVASDESLPPHPIPVLDLNDAKRIADFVLAKAEDYVSSRL